VTPPPGVSPELQAALDAAAAAAEIIRSLYATNLRVDRKTDRTPVTAADVRAEEAIRKVLTSRFPTFGFHGEETGRENEGAESVWLVDPIDGTKSFVRETPFFSTQIGLMRAGRLVLGVSSAPVYGEVAWAEEGRGAYLNGARIQARTKTALEQAIVSTGNLKTLTESAARWRALGDLIRETSRIRGYGDFVHYHLLARGALDVVLESDVNILDIAPLVVIVREAGGVFTDLDGRDISAATTSVLAAGDAALHADLVRRFRRA
jgi:histidinol-phosphatase